MGADVIFGYHAVRTALRTEPGRVHCLWVAAGRRDQRAGELTAMAMQARVPVERASAQELDRRTAGARHQGVVARFSGASSIDDRALEDLLDSLQAPPFLLVLDGVSDPHNLGACLRSADAVGVHAVVAPRDRAVGLTPVVRKVACGAADSVPLAQVPNLARCLELLKSRGIWLLGADAQAGSSLYEVDLRGPLGLVLGAEGRGLRRLTREACDSLVGLPMLGTVESLNVSVAAGVMLYEALRQRRSRGA